MKTQVLVLALALLALAIPRAVAQGEVSQQFFYDSLSPHGEWIEVEGYGECWQPSGIDEGWAPYTDGYWSYTDAGWTWVSYEEFGGITYHYGRWVRADEVGWCWVPDYDWGPAWVSWRSSDDYIGWAPLPPEATFRTSIGISTWVDDSYDIGPGYYNFCPTIEFGAPLIRTVCVPRFEVIGLYGRCVNVTNICFSSYSNVVFCGGPSFSFISGRCRRPIPALKLVRYSDHRGGRFNARNEGNTLQVYAPKIVRNNTTVINKPRITKVVRKEKLNRGWDVVKDPAERQNLRAKIKQESKGLTADTAPARQPKQEDLKPVPTKADPKGPSPVAKAGRRDTDGDGIANRKDKDKDGDGIANRKDKDPSVSGVNDRQPGKVSAEGGASAGVRPGGEKMPGKVGVDNGGREKPAGRDLDGDGVRNRNDKDKDGDGVKDRQPGNPIGVPGKNGGRDLDGDGVRNRNDKDKDGDGVRDRQAAPDGGFQGKTDRPGGARGSVQGDQATVPDNADREARAARLRQAQIEQRQVDREQAAVAMARRQQQAEFQEKQAERALRQQQIQRQQIQRPQVQQQPPQFQRPPRQQFQQPPPQQLPPRQGGGGGGGGGGGKGKRNLTPEEVEQLKKQQKR